MIKKNLRILIIPFLVLLAIMIFFLSKNQNKKTENNLSLSSKEFLPSFVKGDLNIIFDINENKLNLPKNLPYLTKEVLPPLSKNEAELIAKKLGFINLPLESKGVYQGETLIWNNQTYTLSIILNKRTITYELNRSQRDNIYDTKDEEFSEEDIKSYLNTFLLDNFSPLISNLSLTNFYYLKRVEGSTIYKETDRQNSEILQLNYVDGNTEYPILTSNSLQTNMYIQILKDKTISLMELKLMGKFVKNEEEFILKNFEEIKTESKNSKIIDIEDINLTDINSSDIENITINNIFIAYYVENNSQEFLQPVCVLKGLVKLRGYDTKMSVTLYLPAFK